MGGYLPANHKYLALKSTFTGSLNIVTPFHPGILEKYLTMVSAPLDMAISRATHTAEYNHWQEDAYMTCVLTEYMLSLFSVENNKPHHTLLI